MMSKRNFYFLLLAGTVLSFPAWALSSPGRTDTHTHTRVSEPKPASQFAEPDKAYKTASVCFLGVGDCDPNVGYSSGDDYTFDSEQRCLNEGFTKQNCTSVQSIDGVCPYNSAYGKGCKCSSNLVTCPAGQVGVGDACDDKYASCGCSPSLVSCPSNKNGTGASCGGKYQGCSCKSEYVYTSSNCSYPRSLSGSSCDGKYTGCSCPKGISVGSFGCAEYYPAPCSGVCKTAKSDNCDNRSSVPIPYGCAEYWADCPTKCETAYNDNCRNRTAVPTPYGCEQVWGDCQAKCQTAYPDNCRNRTAVSVPANAACSANFSDCPSKCSAWACNSGYKPSGNSCIDACSSTYIAKDGLVYVCETNQAVGFVYNNQKYLIKNGSMGGVSYNPCKNISGYSLPTSGMIYTILNLTGKIAGVWIESDCPHSMSSCFYWSSESCGTDSHYGVSYTRSKSCKNNNTSANYSVCVKKVD